MKRPQRKPNIVIILADDMGYGDVGCYGSRKIQTPNMDAAAAEGLRFTDAHSSSAVCTPSRYSLLTGRYCWRSGLSRGVLGGFGKPLLADGRETLASYLRKQGYTTAMFGKWHLGLEWRDRQGNILRNPAKDGWVRGDGWYEEGFDVDYTAPVGKGPVDNGFDSWFGISGSLDMPPYCFIENRHTVGIPDREKHPYEAQQRPGLMAPGWRDDQVDVVHTEKAVSFIRSHTAAGSGRPFFLYMAPAAPHRPCVPPEFIAGTTGGGKRGDMVALFDWITGELSAALSEVGVFDRTLFIVTSDNGAQLTNFDGRDYGHKPNGDLRGQKADIWEGGHREPLILRWPEAIEPGRVSSDLVGLTDIFATCADIVEAPLPAGSCEDSISFLPTLRNPEVIGSRSSLIHHSYDGMFSIRSGAWKYIDGVGSGGFSEPARYLPLPGQPEAQLYNLADDSRETLNLWAVRPEKAAELKERLHSFGVPETG